jgi:hypothetical protein
MKFLSRARCFCYSLKVTNERNHARPDRDENGRDQRGRNCERSNPETVSGYNPP